MDFRSDASLEEEERIKYIIQLFINKYKIIIIENTQ